MSTAQIVACSGQREAERTLNFAAVGEGLSDLRFFVHDFELIDAQGGLHPMSLIPRSPWQSSRVALIDLTGATSADRNFAIVGRMKEGVHRFVGVRFSLGVPFDLNHANPMTAVPPLNFTEMFWAWQTGHKFLRAEWSSAGQSYAFHLGSTGCSSSSALRPPAEPCARPNVVRVEVRGFDPVADSINVDVRRLLAAFTSAGGRVCTGDYTSTPECAAAYALMGLNEQGRCDGSVCSSQQLFVASLVPPTGSEGKVR